VALLPVVAEAQDPAIFREISIAPYGAIELGRPFTQVDSISREIAENVYLLPPGFGGTLGIAVSLAPEGTVNALIFEYAEDYDFGAAVEGYRDDFGEPDFMGIEEAPSTAPGASKECVYWEDPETRFELYRHGSDHYLSMMLDRGASEEDGRCLLARVVDASVRLLPRGSSTF